jgi:hypothetical protein
VVQAGPARDSSTTLPAGLTMPSEAFWQTMQDDIHGVVMS